MFPRVGKPAPQLTRWDIQTPEELEDSGDFEIKLFFLLEKQALGWPKTNILSVCF